MEREGNEESRAPMKVRGRRLQGVSQADYSAVDRERKGFTSKSTKKKIIHIIIIFEKNISYTIFYIKLFKKINAFLDC